jgi:signal transduction histidine kinase
MSETSESDGPQDALSTGEPAQASILIVDDSPANLRLLAHVLAERGYRPRPVLNGPAALVAAQAALPDLILLDIRMAEMDGYAVCARLKEDERTREVPVIFLSGLNETEAKLRAFRAGGVDFIAKPFQAEEVLVRVETHLALRNLQRQLQAANRELQHRLAELEERNEDLDAFAHTVAHDLKGPLNLTIGYAEILEEEYADLSDDQRLASVRAIIRSGRKMNSIIEELLLLAGVHQKAVVVEPLDMADVVARAQARLADTIQDLGADIALPDTWPAALGYAPWVEEVWANYLSNALKYGGRPPRLELGASAQEGGTVRFWIKDNGPGLTAEEQARLFTPFTRLNAGNTPGHGVGLSIVRRIVERLGGQVGVESAPDQGSVFTFTLPACL